MPTKNTKPKKTTPITPEEVIEQEQPTLSPEPNEELITFKRSHFYSVLVVLAFAIGLMLGFVIWGRESNPIVVAAEETQNQPSGQVEEAPITPEAPQVTRYDIPTEGYPSLGPDDAAITIVEFSDFQCPFCRRFHQETYSALLEAYPGQIRFVYRNLPLTSIHPDAMPAAVASLCANEQNAYWDYHGKLFSSESLGREVYIQYASDLNLNTEDFTACLDSAKFDDFIEQDMDFALNLGVQSTPTFFVNGLAIVGAQPLSAFQQLIDQELAGEIP